MDHKSSIMNIIKQAMSYCMNAPFYTDEELTNMVDNYVKQFPTLNESDRNALLNNVLTTKRKLITSSDFTVKIMEEHQNKEIGPHIVTEKFNLIIADNIYNNTVLLNLDQLSALYDSLAGDYLTTVLYKSVMNNLSKKFNDYNMSKLKKLLMLFTGIGVYSTEPLNNIKRVSIANMINILDELLDINIPSIHQLYNMILDKINLSTEKQIKLHDILSEYNIINSDQYEDLSNNIIDELQLECNDEVMLRKLVNSKNIWVKENTITNITYLLEDLTEKELMHTKELLEDGDITSIVANSLLLAVGTKNNAYIILDYYIEKCTDSAINNELEHSDSELVNLLLEIIPTDKNNYNDIQTTSIFYKNFMKDYLTKYYKHSDEHIIKTIIRIIEYNTFKSVLADSVTKGEYEDYIRLTLYKSISDLGKKFIADKPEIINKIIERIKQITTQNAINKYQREFESATLNNEEIDETIVNIANVTIIDNQNVTITEILSTNYNETFNDSVNDLKDKLKNNEITSAEFNVQYLKLTKNLQRDLTNQRKIVDTLQEVSRNINNNPDNYPLIDNILDRIKMQIQDLLRKINNDENLEIKSSASIGDTKYTADDVINTYEGLLTTNVVDTNSDDDINKLMNSSIVDHKNPMYTITANLNKTLVTHNDLLTIKMGNKLYTKNVTTNLSVADLSTLFPDIINIINNTIVFTNKESIDKPIIITANDTLNIPGTATLSIIDKVPTKKIISKKSSVPQSNLLINNNDSPIINDGSDSADINVTIDNVTKTITVDTSDTVCSFNNKLQDLFPGQVEITDTGLVFASNNVDIQSDTPINVSNDVTELPDKTIGIDNPISTTSVDVNPDDTLSTSGSVSGDATVTIDGNDVKVPINDAVTTEDMLSQISDYFQNNPQYGLSVSLDSGKLSFDSNNGNNNIKITPPDTADNVGPIDADLDTLNVAIGNTSNTNITTDPVSDNLLNNPFKAARNNDILNAVDNLLNNSGDKATEDPASLEKGLSGLKPIGVQVNDDALNTISKLSSGVEYLDTKDSESDPDVVPTIDPVNYVTPIPKSKRRKNGVNPNSSGLTNNIDIGTDTNMLASHLKVVGAGNIDSPGSGGTNIKLKHNNSLLPAYNSIQSKLDAINNKFENAKNSKIGEPLYKLLTGHDIKYTYNKQIVLQGRDIKSPKEYIDGYAARAINSIHKYSNKLKSNMSAWFEARMKILRKFNEFLDRILGRTFGKLSFGVAHLGISMSVLTKSSGMSRLICHPPTLSQILGMIRDALSRVMHSTMGELDSIATLIMSLIKNLISMIIGMLQKIKQIIMRMINMLRTLLNSAKSIVIDVIKSITMSLGANACEIIVGLMSVIRLIMKIIQIIKAIASMIRFF